MDNKFIVAATTIGQLIIAGGVIVAIVILALGHIIDGATAIASILAAAGIGSGVAGVVHASSIARSSNAPPAGS